MITRRANTRRHTRPSAATRAARQIQADRLRVNEAADLAFRLITERTWPIREAISAAAIALNLTPYQTSELQERLTGLHNEGVTP